ncbi:Hsp20/alpha crystallin family protein [Mucisphaera calidilacus]|nr:Hsp20/alpha crystallin family protein [Mucisphaera calidilacus]
METGWFRGDEACSFDSSWSPAINVFRTPTELHVCLDLAGVEPTSISVEFAEGQLVVRGERVCPQPEIVDPSKGRIEVMEIDYGSFVRVIEVPVRLDLTSVRQVYDRGLMHLTLPLVSRTETEIPGSTETPSSVG